MGSGAQNSLLATACIVFIYVLNGILTLWNRGLNKDAFTKSESLKSRRSVMISGPLQLCSGDFTTLN